VCFRVGSRDAESLAKEFEPEFTLEDLVKLEKFHVYLKLMVDGVSTIPFSALTLAPIAKSTGSTEKVIRISREKYGMKRSVIEEKIMKWSGMIVDGETETEETGEPAEENKTPAPREHHTAAAPEKPAGPPPKPQLMNTHQPKDKPAHAAPVHTAPVHHETPEAVHHAPAPTPAPAAAESSPLATFQFGAPAATEESEQHHAPAPSPVQNFSFNPTAAPSAPSVPSTNTMASGALSGEKKKRKRKRKKKSGAQTPTGTPNAPDPKLMDSQPVTIDTTQAGELSLFNLNDH
jgi:hypothetical protein